LKLDELGPILDTERERVGFGKWELKITRVEVKMATEKEEWKEFETVPPKMGKRIFINVRPWIRGAEKRPSDVRFILGMCANVCMCVRVCVRDRERERGET